ncbi:MAG TPA: Calx-beta domain-containing protein, partial [Pyrinomonadaceae bacterium]|nr:Calx-beta domain-containing protein [Pyrinomonadaceae bacterium]
MKHLVRLCCALAAALPLGVALSSTTASSSAGARSHDRSLPTAARLASNVASAAEKEANNATATAPSPGKLSFSRPNYGVKESTGAASITLTRSGGTAGKVAAKVTLADVTTNSSDYNFNPGSLDAGFDRSAAPNTVYSVVEQPDGKILIGGYFSPILRLNADGSTDTSFNTGTGANAIVNTVVLQPDGKVLIGGYFTFVNQTSHNFFARLNSNGSLDTSFNTGTGANNTVWALALQPDGKILVGGDFSSVDGVARNGLARVNADGSLDTTFDAALGLSQTVHAILIQPDGRILIGGSFSRVNGTTRNNIARLNADGTLDTSFDPGSGASDVVLSIARQSGGKVLIGGQFTKVNGATQNRIARLNTDGTLDMSFNAGSGANNFVEVVAVQPDDGIFIAGDFDIVNGTARNRIARLTANGALDATFKPVLTASPGGVHSLFVQPDGKVLAGSDAFGYTGSTRNSYLFRFNGDLFAAWPDGDGADKTVVLPVVNDGIAEPPETLNLTLTPLGGALAGANVNATLTISDTDLPPNITSAAPPSTVNLGASYSHTFVATGVPDPTFSVASGILPTGLTLTSAGLLSGTPTTAGTFGNIVVKADNGVAPAATQTFSIKVNTPPVADDDSYQIAMNGTLSITAPGVLSNDADADGDHLSAALIDNVTHGSLTLNTDGSLTYTPAAGFFGADSFTYKAGDGIADSGAATVRIAVVSPAGGLVEFSQGLYTVSERGGSVSINVKRTGDTTRAAAVGYTTDDGSIPSVAVPCSSVTGIALERCDYTRAAGTLNFAAGETQKTFVVPVNDDSYTEGTENTSLKLSNPSGGAALGAQSSATLQITDDAQQTSNPVDDSSAFVRQHYHDFLNREPDQSGLAFWTNEIESCGSDSQCRDVKRINVSAAFFLSIEFQQTGYLVERIYKASFGDTTGTSTFPASHQLSVPVIRLDEFLRDTQEIGQGVAVGVGDWQGQLESNKQSFASEFVQRQRFTTAFPTSQTPAQFVDA